MDAPDEPLSRAETRGLIKAIGETMAEERKGAIKRERELLNLIDDIERRLAAVERATEQRSGE